MLLLKIKKSLSLLFPKSTTSPNLFNHVHCLSSSSAAAAASKTLNPSPQSNPIAEFLVSSCGLSSKRAAAAFKYIPKSTSIDQAHSVRHFFIHHGFTDTHIRKLISIRPQILHADVHKTLHPNLQTLHEMGFAESDLQLLVVSSPPLLVNPLTIPRLEFWQNFLRTSSRKDLVMVLMKHSNLITLDIDSGIGPKLALLKEHGLSETDIVGIVRRDRVINMSYKKISTLLKRVKELGFEPTTPMFGHALSCLSRLGSDTFEAKMEIYKGFGWSKEQLLSALKKAPVLINLSKENIFEKMEFLVERAGCKQSYIASNPVLLMYSLKKRLKPRHYVMEVLKLNGIVTRGRLYPIMCLPVKKFVESIILPNMQRVPEIHDIYIAACADQMPL